MQRVSKRLLTAALGIVSVSSIVYTLARPREGAADHSPDALAEQAPVSARARVDRSHSRPEDHPSEAHSSRAASHGRGRDVARERLRALKLSWDEKSLLQVPESASETPDFERPRELARRFGVEELSFVERRDNGRDVYRTPDGMITMKSDVERGYWKMLRREGSHGHVLSEQEVLARGKELQEKTGFPEEQRGDMRDSPLASGTAEEETVVGHTVHVAREVNGLEVEGSRVLAVYDDDEVPLAVEARWPKFDMVDAPKLKTPEEAQEEIAAALAERYEQTGAEPQLRHKLTYQQNESGRYEPVLTVWAMEGTTGTPESIEYSLVDGLRSTTDDTSDAEDDT